MGPFPNIYINNPHKHWHFEWKREFHLLMQSCPSDEQDELVLVILTPFWQGSDLGAVPARERLYILNNPHKH